MVGGRAAKGQATVGLLELSGDGIGRGQRGQARKLEGGGAGDNAGTVDELTFDIPQRF